MSVNIVTDRSKNIVWNARRGDDQSIHIDFVNNSNPYDITSENFTLEMYRYSGGNILTLTQGSGLTNGGTSGLDIALTKAQMGISADHYLVFLRSVNTGTNKLMTWLNVSFILNGELWDGSATIEETIIVQTGPITLTLEITLAGGSGGGGSGNPQFLGNWTELESDDFPTQGSGDGNTLREGDSWRLVFAVPGTPKIIDNVVYENGNIIQYAGSGRWNSWPSNNGATS